MVSKRLCILIQKFAIMRINREIIEGGLKLKRLHLSRNIILIVLVAFFMGLGSLGTIALANYTNVVVKASSVNVRLGPGLSYDIMTQVQSETVVNVLAEENEWYKIRMDDGRIGRIASWLVDNTEVTASSDLLATVTEPSVNVRAENNESSEIIGTAVLGETYTLLYEENGWSQIAYGDGVAWLYSDLISIEPGILTEETTSQELVAGSQANPDLITISQDSVNVRTSPSLQSSIVETANQGTTYEYLGKSGDFIEVLTESGQTAYIASWLVTQVASVQTEVVAPVVSTTLSEATIVIDAGHGGTDPGAINDYFYEKQVTLDTAQVLADKLGAMGANVIMTRTTDESISLDERAETSINHQADLFISLHYDSTPEGVVKSGTTTYYYDDSDSKIAELINNELTANLPLQNNGFHFGNYLVLRENTQPAVLLELGYMNNPDDFYSFNNGYYQDLVADSILNALINYFN